jgi:hypothetical protein
MGGMDENSKPPKRRWVRFSLKAVMVAMLLIGSFLAGWKACEVEYREDAEQWRKRQALRKRLIQEMEKAENFLDSK